MILACPECRTRYQVADNAMADGRARFVRCANCGYTWLWRPVPAPPAAPEPPALPPDMRAPRQPPRLLVEPEAPPASPPRRRRPGAGTRLLLVLLAILAVAAAVGFFARDQIAAAWPPASHFYSVIGIKVAPLPRG